MLCFLALYFISHWLSNSKCETLWVNDFLADRFCFNKLLQLEAAKAVGFNIPETLVTNDPEKVREFVKSHAGRAITKSFSPAVWDNDDGSRTIRKTSLIGESDLINDFPIAACPAIYQEVIEKNFELRVNIFGDQVVSAAIDSQQGGPTIDWRYEGGRGISNVRNFQLETKVSEQCLKLARHFGLGFCAIDLIVTPQGRVVFLEANNTAQFLWLENALPSLPILDIFCRFLLNGSASNRKPIRLSDFYNCAS